MKYSKILLFNVFMIGLSLSAKSQCKTEFDIKTYPSLRGDKTGSIQLTKRDNLIDFVVKLYSINGDIKLEQTKLLQAAEKSIIINDLGVGYYMVKVEWNALCSKTLGGIEGIEIVENAD